MSSYKSDSDGNHPVIAEMKRNVARLNTGAELDVGDVAERSLMMAGPEARAGAIREIEQAAERFEAKLRSDRRPNFSG